MLKPRYPNEAELRKYIMNIANHRNNQSALEYIEMKLDNFSFSDEFISWCEIIRKQLRDSINKPTIQKTTRSKPIAEPLPEIYFSYLSEAREKEHLRVTRKHTELKRNEYLVESEKTGNALFNVKDDIRYAADDEKLDLIREFHRLGAQKSDYGEWAEYANITLKDPYFGRFDFADSDGSKKVLYISKTNVSWYVNNHHNVNFVDWRSPIADLFYRYQSPTKNVSFKNAKGEDISGDLALTARFQIENGAITGITYSSTTGDKSTSQAADDILQEKLSNNSNEHMTEIVETIQPEQNKIVRHEPEEDMIVQGVAGSGKTAVALHRIAYIIYKKPELKHNGVLFISPNDAFSEYVSNVLPELGEFYIPIITFDEATNNIFNGTLEHDDESSSETIKDFIEKYYKTGKLDKSIKTKFTVTFGDKFYRLCNKIRNEGALIERYFAIRDELYSTKKDIQLQNSLITKYKRTVKSKDYNDKEEREAREKLPGAIIRKDELRNNLVAYRKAYAAMNKKIEKRKDIYKIRNAKDGEKEIVSIRLAKTAYQYFKDICNEKKVDIRSYENTPYMAILRFLVDQANGKKRENLSVKHIVIDEAQDYIEPYIYFLRIAYPNATFTILGDTNQNINPYYQHGSLEKLLPNSSYYEMDKAYRSSPGIVKYCNDILGITSVKPARLSNGETVEEFTTTDAATEITTIQAAIDYYNKKDYRRIGIITRDQNSADWLKTSLKNDKLTILPVYQAKGLEYDAAIVIDNFKENEKELYYVACSRAQHGLTVIHKKTSQKVAQPTKTTSKTPPEKTEPQRERSEAPSQKPAVQKDNDTQQRKEKAEPTTTIRIKTKPKGLFARIKAAVKAAIDTFNE